MRTMLSRLWRVFTGPASIFDTVSDEKSCMLRKDLDSSPYPYLRRVTSFQSAVTIHGILPRRSNGDPAGYLCLVEPYPAQVQYILGPDWESKLVPLYFDNTEKKDTPMIIPSSDDPSDEGEHCLRMRRCGANLDGLAYVELVRYDLLTRHMNKQIMGWPSRGGVWVWAWSQLSEVQLTAEEIESMTDDTQLPIAPVQVEDLGTKKFVLQDRLQRQIDMDGFCQVLRDVGGIFYECIEDCPEVIHLGLATPDWMLAIVKSQ